MSSLNNEKEISLGVETSNVLRFEDIENMAKMLEEDERQARKMPSLENCFSDLITGEIMRDCGNQWAILMGPRGGLGLVCGIYWWFYIHKNAWKMYLDFCIKEKSERFNGVFQKAALSLPAGMGGSGRLVDMLGIKRERNESTD